MKEWQTVGKLPIDVTVRIEHLSYAIQKYDDSNGYIWYEIHQTLEITSIIDDIEIKKISKLRQKLNDDEVQQIREKGLIKTKLK